MSGSEQTMTASQIAELAGVSRSAVSNWRRRQADFPAPVGTAAGGGDLFRVADVEAWLEGHLGQRRRLDPGQAMWIALDSIRGSLPMNEGTEIVADAIALSEVVARNSPRQLETLRGLPQAALVDALTEAASGHDLNGVPARELADGLSDTVRLPNAPSLAHQALALDSTAERSQAFEYLLSATRRALGRRGGEHETSAELATLLLELAGPLEGAVLDPAAGQGTLLLEAGRRAGERGVHLIGQEINRSTHRLACERLYLHGLHADIRCEDALSAPSVESGDADTVLCDPPYGLQLRGGQASPDDPRWFAGSPGRIGDLIWIQLAIVRLRGETSRGYVVNPAGSTFRGGRETGVRAELLRRGLVEAVIGLPQGMASNTSLALSVWVVRGLAGGQEALPVLFIDGSRSAEGSTDAVRQFSDRTIAALNGFRSDPENFAGVPDFARSVPILELLGPQTTLLPSNWVGAVDGEQIEKSIQQRVASVIQAKGRLDAQAFPRFETRTVDDSGAPLRVADLLAAGKLKLLRGVRVEEAALSERGRPLVGAPELRLRSPEQRHIAEGRIPQKAEITEAGDVLIAPISNPPKAVIEQDGGRVLAAPLVALRSLPGGLPPEILAAAISSEHNARNVSGAAIPHVRVRDLEIPRLDPGDAHGAAKLLSALNDQIESAELLVLEARALRAAIRDGLATDRIRLEVPQDGRDGR